MMFRYQLRTRYSETGQDGIIHHSCFVIYLEEARIEFLKSIGCHIGELEKKHVFCPVVDLQVKYRKPLYVLDEVTIEVVVESFSKVKFAFGYTLFRDKEKVATAIGSHCFVNASFKPIPILPGVMAVFKEASLDR